MYTVHRFGPSTGPPLPSLVADEVCSAEVIIGIVMAGVSRRCEFGDEEKAVNETHRETPFGVSIEHLSIGLCIRSPPKNERSPP